MLGRSSVIGLSLACLGKTTYMYQHVQVQIRTFWSFLITGTPSSLILSYSYYQPSEAFGIDLYSLPYDLICV